MAISSRAKKVTTQTLVKMKQSGEKIAMLTCYDATFAEAMDRAGVDIILIGDSLGMVVQGRETTVLRGSQKVVGDVPVISKLPQGARGDGPHSHLPRSRSRGRSRE